MAWTLVVVGFGAKVGLVPLQVWIPVGYPAAPGPARAAMAGIAANVGVYGLWRFLGVLGRPPVWLVIGVLLVGGITALLGITFAGVQGRLGAGDRLLEHRERRPDRHAFGVAMTGAVVHRRRCSHGSLGSHPADGRPRHRQVSAVHLTGQRRDGHRHGRTRTAPWHRQALR